MSNSTTTLTPTDISLSQTCLSSGGDARTPRRAAPRSAAQRSAAPHPLSLRTPLHRPYANFMLTTTNLRTLTYDSQHFCLVASDKLQTLHKVLVVFTQTPDSNFSHNFVLYFINLFISATKFSLLHICSIDNVNEI